MINGFNDLERLTALCPPWPLVAYTIPSINAISTMLIYPGHHAMLQLRDATEDGQICCLQDKAEWQYAVDGLPPVWTRDNRDSVIKLASLHYGLVCIQPFADKIREGLRRPTYEVRHYFGQPIFFIGLFQFFGTDV